MSDFTGRRGSTRRAVLIWGFVALGTVIFLISAVSIKVGGSQVYWAVYSRVRPMRSDTDYATGKLEGSDQSNINVELLPISNEPLTSRSKEKDAAKKAHQVEGEKAEVKEERELEAVALQLKGKAKAAFNKEIEAVTGGGGRRSLLTVDASVSHRQQIRQKHKQMRDSLHPSEADRQSRLPVLQTQVAQLEEALASLKGEVAALVGQGDVEGGGDAEHAQHSVLSSDTRYQLTRERVEGLAQGGVILITWADIHYLDFVLNWLKLLQGLKVTSYMVGTVDRQIFKALVDNGHHNVFTLHSSLQAGGLGRGSSQKLLQVPAHLADSVTAMGFDVILSHADVAWLKDPFPYFARFPEADVLFSSSAMTSTVKDEGLESLLDASKCCNLGVVLVRKRAADFAQEWKATASKGTSSGEQTIFMDLLRPDAIARTDRLLRGFGGALLVGVLPVALFASGHTFYIRNLAEALGLEPYAAHNNFQFSGLEGKRHRFREALLWTQDPEQYYDPPGGLLSLDIKEGQRKSDHLLLLDLAKPKSAEGPEVDLAALEARMAQLRNALALCHILNRTLVLPSLTSGAEQWWNVGNQGAVRSTPADFVLDLERMARHGRIPFRESSFFQNARVPETVQQGKLQISMCKEGEVCTSPTSFKSEPTSLHLTHGLKDSEISAVFKGFSLTKVLHFQELANGFDHFFTSPEDAKRFDKLVEGYSSLLCCMQAGATVDKQEQNLVEKWTPILGGS